MFMTDHPAGSCNYHHCANLAMAATTSGTGGMTGTGDAGAGDGSAGPDGAKSGTGGATTGAGGATTGAGGATTGAGGAATGAGGAAAGVGGATAGVGGAAVGTGGAMAGAGGSTGGGHDSGPIVGEPSSDGCSCGLAGGAMGSWSGVLFLAALALRRRRGKK